MEFTPLVPDGLPAWTLVLARAELAEILGRPGDGIGEEMHLYPAERLTCVS